MKILMLSWEYPPRIVGGISRVVYDLAQELGKSGNEVHVVTYYEKGTKEIEKDGNVYVHRVHSYDVNSNNFIDWVLHFNFSMVEHCIKLVSQTGEFDIIHAHDWIVAFAARVLKHAYQKPLVSTIHATEYGRNYGLHNDMQRYISSIEWWLTYESWRVICNSNYMRQEIKHVFQLPDDKISVIPNGVDIYKFKDVHRNIIFRRNYAADNEKIVFYVGRLVREKGVHVLIDSIPKIASRYNDVKFVVAGKGPEIDYLRSKAANMGVENRVYFTGYISDADLLKLYKCADISVFPSLYEPFGIVALEGMVAETPVVVSNVGGLGDIVEHRVDGMKVSPGNADELADSILELLFNPELVSSIKQNALNKIKDVYNWELITKKTAEIYTEIIKNYKELTWKGLTIKEYIDDSSKADSSQNYYLQMYGSSRKKHNKSSTKQTVIFETK